MLQYNTICTLSLLPASHPCITSWGHPVSVSHPYVCVSHHGNIPVFESHIMGTLQCLCIASWEHACICVTSCGHPRVCASHHGTPRCLCITSCGHSRVCASHHGIPRCLCITSCGHPHVCASYHGNILVFAHHIMGTSPCLCITSRDIPVSVHHGTPLCWCITS